MFDSLIKLAPENFYTWMEFYFKILGLQPPKDRKWKLLYVLVATIHVCISTFLVTGLEWTKLFLDFNDDFKNSMLTLSLGTMHLVFIFRIIFWPFTRAKLMKIAEAVQRDSFEFTCFSIYNVKYKHVLNKARWKVLEYADLRKLWSQAQIFVNDDKNAIEGFRKAKMAQTRALCCFIYLGITVLSLFTIFVSYIFILSADKYEMFNERYNATLIYRVYPYHMYFPFDTSVSHGFYWVGYFYQLYAYFSTMLTFLPIDTIAVNSMIHVISQTIVVGEAFNQLEENIDCNDSLETIKLIQEIRIVKCISELQNIYRVIYLLEDLYNVQLLIQYGASVFILCSLCYIIPLIDNIGEFICRIIFLSATLGEIFIFTYCSQTLSLELQNIKDVVYNLNWTNFSPKLKRDLVFIISRLQKPCVLTVGKIFNLDLQFFIQVTQKSYSFYTLISNTSK